MGNRQLSEWFELLYPCVLLYAFYQLVQAELVVQGLLAVLSVFIVATGWMSFRATAHAFPMRSLFLIDVGLMLSYVFLISSVSRSVTSTDQILFWATSGVVTLLYCAWDVVAYLRTRSDGVTEALVVAQLRHFAVAMALASPAFGCLAVVQATESNSGVAAFGIGLLIWVGILLAWNLQAARSGARE